MAKITIEDKKVTTTEFRTSFPTVFKPKAYRNQEPKYSITMLFPKKADLTAMKRAAFNAATEKWGAKDQWPARLKMPFRDGNEKADMKGYKDHIFVSATSKQRPGLVNQKRENILSEEEFYAGCYARATLIAFAYDVDGNKGVSFSLQNLQKLKDGEKFSGRREASEEFDEVEDSSDDSSSYGGDSEEDDLGF